MRIRSAIASDAPSIAAIWNAEIREGVSTFNAVEKTETEIADLVAERPAAFIVAEKKGQLLGFATFSQFRGGVGYTHSMEHTVYLAPDARGQGAGRALMTRLEEIGEETGCACFDRRDWR